MYQSRLAIRAPVLLLATLLGFQSLAPQSAFAGATEWVDIQVVNGLLLVETEMGGVSGYSMIDTGAELTSINETFLEAADLTYQKGISVKVSGVFGTEWRRTYVKIPVELFGNSINFHDIVELDFGTPDIQMVLGANFLKNYIFQFDYPNQRLRLITRDSLDLKKVKNIDSRRNPQGGSPLVKVSLSEKIDAWLTMDTGANGGIMIDRNLARKLKWLDTYASVESEVSGVISSGDMEHFTVPSIVFGPTEIADVMVTIPVSGESLEIFKKYVPLGTRVPRKSGKSKGLLGYDILQHFVVTIDYLTGHVHVQVGEKLPEEP